MTGTGAGDVLRRLRWRAALAAEPLLRRLGIRVWVRPPVIGEAIPLFLIACPRSGTTLLRHILNAHPEILLTNETAVFIQLNAILTRSHWGAPAGILFGKQHHRLWADHLADLAREWIEQYYARIARVEGKARLKYWGEKHPHNYECLAFIRARWPEARYIYLVRDPRDCALSIGRVTGEPFRDSLENWKAFADPYEQFVAGRPSETLLTLRFEDLVGDYAGVTRRCIEWLGVEPHPAVSDYLARFRNTDAHAVSDLMDHGRPPGNGSVKDFRGSAVGRWQRELTDADRIFAAELAGGFLRKYGYGSGGPPGRPEPNMGRTSSR